MNKRFNDYLVNKKALISLVFVFALVFVLAMISQPMLVGKAIDALLAMDMSSFVLIIAITSSLAALGVIAGYLFEYFVGLVTQKVITEIRLDVYEKINAIPVEVFHKKTKGDLLQMEVNDIENVANGMFAVFKSLIEGVFMIATTVILMMIINWAMAILVICLSPLCIIMSRFVSKYSHKYFKKQVSLQSDIGGNTSELIKNLDLYQSYNYEEKAYKHYENRSKELQKRGKIALFSASWVNPSTRLVNNTIFAIIGVFGIVLIIYTNASASWVMNLSIGMSIGKLSSFLIYINQYTKPFNEISGVVAEYEAARTSFERIDKFLNSKDDVNEGKETINEIKKIEFRNVSFAYDKNKPLIKNFNLVINKGEKIAIVGPTGAGKTTLINLILRFYDIDSGELLINDVNINDISKESLRNALAMVLQETWIFKGSVLDNVRYANKNATKEEVIKACELAHSDTFINTLSKGYNTLVGSSEGLSEGERQIIAISRVMLLNPSLIILDEATSNIDTRSERYINDDFDKLMKNKTSIVIAHRLSTIQSADKILVIDNGDIVEVGNHKELLSKKGLYYSMYNSQFSD